MASASSLLDESYSLPETTVQVLSTRVWGTRLKLSGLGTSTRIF